jgi:thiosulfate/3-mercaptopyruvate sulfurtransferase
VIRRFNFRRSGTAPKSWRLMRSCSATMLVVLLSSGRVLGQDAEYPRAELLIEPAAVEQTAGSRQRVVLDARSREAYLEGHIPAAVWVDHGDWAKSFEQGQDPAIWQEKIRALGIHNDSRIVVYDDSAMKDAARVWWILRYWGADDVRVLHGGWRDWKRAAHPIETGDSDGPPVGDFVVRRQDARLAVKDQLLGALAGQSWQVVDARSFDEYCGVEALKNRRSGAIPGARHLEWSDLIDAETHRFLPPVELRRLFAEAHIDLTRPTATHCQSGGRASVMALGLELMGAPEVRNYYRGWSEWGNSDETPVEKIEAPSQP